MAPRQQPRCGEGSAGGRWARGASRSARVGVRGGRGSRSGPAPPPPRGRAAPGPGRPRPVPAGAGRAGGWFPLRACRTLPADVRRAGGRRAEGGGGRSRYVRVVLRFLGLRLQRAGGGRRPGRGRAARHRALRHVPAWRCLVRRRRSYRRGDLYYSLCAVRTETAPRRRRRRHCRPGGAGQDGTCSPRRRASSADPGHRFRPGGLQLPAAPRGRCSGSCPARRMMGLVVPLPQAPGWTSLRRRGSSSPHRRPGL